MKIPQLAAALAQYGTAKRLAKTIKRHPATLSRILCGKAQPTPETARRIARVLGSTPAKLGLQEVKR